MRRALQTAAGLALAWLAMWAASIASADPVAPIPPAAPTDAPPARPPVPSIGPAYDRDDAMPVHADPIASYTLRASLDPEKHLVDGTGTITWRNASRVPQREIWLHLYLNGFKSDRTLFMRVPVGGFRGGGLTATGHVDVKRLAIHGTAADLWPGRDRTSPGDPDDETDIRVPLPDAIEPGGTVTFDVAWQSQLPALSFRTGHFRGFHMVGQWFPKLARLEPDGRWAHFAFHRLSEFYADYGAYDVTVDAPEAQVVGATGRLESEVRGAGRVERRFVQEDVHDFAFTAWERFRELTGKSDDGTAIRVLYPPDHDRAAEDELDTVKYGLDRFGKAFGRYPYRTLTVVHPPEGGEEAGGMEYPTLITTGGYWYLPYTGAHIVDNVTIHELGHQWFYGLAGTDEHAWPFLDEGINSYAEADALEARYPGSSAYRGLGLLLGLPAIQRWSSADVARNAPVAQPAPAFLSGTDYAGLVYERTATILRTLANVYGEAEVRRAIGRYARRYRFDHPGPEELIGAVAEVVGDDAAAQLRVALFDRGTVDYAVDTLFSEAAPAPRAADAGAPPVADAGAPMVSDAGAPMVSDAGASIEAADAGASADAGATADAGAPAVSDAWQGSVVARRRGALRFPVDIDLIAEDGSKQRIRWDARAVAERIPYRGKSRLVAVVIDPDHRVLLDDDLSNNARRFSRSSLSRRVLERATFGAEVILGGVLP